MGKEIVLVDFAMGSRIVNKYVYQENSIMLIFLYNLLVCFCVLIFSVSL